MTTIAIVFEGAKSGLNGGGSANIASAPELNGNGSANAPVVAPE